MLKYGLIIAAAFAVGACSRTENGDVVVKRPGEVDIKTTQDTLHLPTIGTRTDTINTPTVGTKPETVIVNKPVIGSKKTVVKTPTIQKKP